MYSIPHVPRNPELWKHPKSCFLHVAWCVFSGSCAVWLTSCCRCQHTRLSEWYSTISFNMTMRRTIQVPVFNVKDIWDRRVCSGRPSVTRRGLPRVQFKPHLIDCKWAHYLIVWLDDDHYCEKDSLVFQCVYAVLHGDCHCLSCLWCLNLCRTSTHKPIWACYEISNIGHSYRKTMKTIW